MCPLSMANIHLRQGLKWWQALATSVGSTAAQCWLMEAFRALMLLWLVVQISLSNFP